MNEPHMLQSSYYLIIVVQRLLRYKIEILSFWLQDLESQTYTTLNASLRLIQIDTYQNNI